MGIYAHAYVMCIYRVQEEYSTTLYLHVLYSTLLFGSCTVTLALIGHRTRGLRSVAPIIDPDMLPPFQHFSSAAAAAPSCTNAHRLA